MSAETTHHSIRVTADGSAYGLDFAFVCEAPAEALCHAHYNCMCSEWHSEEVIAGVPRHLDSDDTTHVGHFVDECRLDDWFIGSDVVFGSVDIPVRPEWLDGYAFHIGGAS